MYTRLKKLTLTVMLKRYNVNWIVWFQRISIPPPWKVFHLNSPSPLEFPVKLHTFPYKFWLLRPPFPWEFPLTFHGVGMDIFRTTHFLLYSVECSCSWCWSCRCFGVRGFLLILIRNYTIFYITHVVKGLMPLNSAHYT